MLSESQHVRVIEVGGRRYVYKPVQNVWRWWEERNAADLGCNRDVCDLLQHILVLEDRTPKVPSALRDELRSLVVERDRVNAEFNLQIENLRNICLHHNAHRVLHMGESCYHCPDCDRCDVPRC